MKTRHLPGCFKHKETKNEIPGTMLHKTIEKRFVLVLGVTALFAVASGLTACDVINMDNLRGTGQLNVHMSNAGDAAAKVTSSPEASGEIAGNHNKSPGELEEVNIDVQELNVLYTETRPDTSIVNDTVSIDTVEVEAQWISLDITPEKINLLDLSDAGTLLAESEVPEGYYGELRLVLGDDNDVVVDGERQEMKVPSGQQSGYKIKFGERLHSGEIVDLTLEFDAEHSVHVTGNGRYMLKPVLKVR